MNFNKILKIVTVSYKKIGTRICNIYTVFSKPELAPAFNIDSHMTKCERAKLYELSSDSNIIVEIGSYIGASACCFGASMLKKDSGVIMCIDTWNNDAMSEGSRDTWLEFEKNTIKYKKFIKPIRGYSTKVLNQVVSQSKEIDLLFIDGDHSYKGAKADWDSYCGFLKTGSIVIFHDYGWAKGVQKVVHEDVTPCVKSFGQLPNMWWGVIS